MKKIISVLTLLTIALFTAQVIFAAAAPGAPGAVTQCIMRHDNINSAAGYTGFECPNSPNPCPFDSTTYTCGACCMLDTIFTVTDWLFYIALAIAIIFIVLGAFTIITAGGSPDKVTAGRNYILYAVIGLLVGLAARAIPAIARAILGV